MRSLLRAIASALRSWLSLLRGEPAAQHLERQASADPDGDALHEIGVGAATAATQLSVEARATQDTGASALATDEDPRERDGVKESLGFRAIDEPGGRIIIKSIDRETGSGGEPDNGNAVVPPVGLEPPPANAATSDEQPRISGGTAPPMSDNSIRSTNEDLLELAEPATGGDGSNQLAEATAACEVEDLPTVDASRETGVVPRDAQGDSGADKGGHQRQEAVVGSVGESYEEVEQPAQGQGTDDAVKAAMPAEPLAATFGNDLVNHTGRVAGEVQDVPARDGGGSSGTSTSAKPEQERDIPAPLPAAARKSEPLRARQYRAPAGGPQPRPVPRARLPHAEKSPPRDRAAPIHVRVIFQRGGYCTVSVLPRRLPGLPERLMVSSTEGEVALVALQDDWYQDVVPDNFADLLRKGLVWKDSGTGQEWRLSGREVFVLAPGTTHRGFVSCPGLTLGRNHAVLCTTAQLGPVKDALRAAGCVNWSQLEKDDGAPSGWHLLREVVPQRPVPPSGEDDILNILRPRPEIEVALEGGIRLGWNNWLLGYPPAIHIYGDPEHTQAVLIDGQAAAVCDPDGYRAPGWDIEGDHHVWCSGTNKRYSLARSEADWSYWPAFSFAISSPRGVDHRFEFCGPLVRPVALGGPSNQRTMVQVPATNPILLGASSGEVFVARPRLDLRRPQCFGLPAFDPVWALPPQPLHCDKRANKILLLQEPTAGGSRANQAHTAGRRDLERWCQLILDANRKGLAVEPATSATADLWREYKQLARSLWRRLR